jgi:serine/threonine protein kinase
MIDPNRTGAYQRETPTQPPAPDSFDAGSSSHPQQIGRYRVEEILGRGGFGLVYLAHDDKLQGLIAIKVPDRNRVPSAEETQSYLTEARTVAGLATPEGRRRSTGVLRPHGKTASHVCGNGGCSLLRAIATRMATALVCGNGGCSLLRAIAT